MMQEIMDHPGVRNCELTGYPDGKEPTYPHCPVCGSECDTVYRDKDRNIVGCDECISTADAWEVEDCFPEKE